MCAEQHKAASLAVTYRVYSRFRPQAMQAAADALDFGTLKKVKRTA